MITSEEIIQKLNDTLDMKGDFALDDEYAKHIMDTAPIIKELKTLDPVVAGDILRGVLDGHSKGYLLVDDLLDEIVREGVDRDWYTTVYARSGTATVESYEKYDDDL